VVKRFLFALLVTAVAGLSTAVAGLLFVTPAAQAQDISTKKEMSQETINVELIEAMKLRQEELDRREKELESRTGRVRSLEQDLDKKIEELKRLQMKLEELIKLRGDVEKKNVASLSKTYAAMPPEDAADRMKVMDRAIALKILGAMKSKKAAKILGSLDTETATEMTEQLAKRPLKR
jgi:flagellar motility protein MotE (MotC chaperone)